MVRLLCVIRMNWVCTLISRTRSVKRAMLALRKALEKKAVASEGEMQKTDGLSMQVFPGSGSVSGLPVTRAESRS